MTQITLKKDSTLEYRRWGDLVFDTATAQYKLTGNKILLTYYPIEVDTTEWMELRKQGITIMENELERNSFSAPKKLLLRKDKLFLFDNEGNFIKRKRNSQNKKQKFYLKKY